MNAIIIVHTSLYIYGSIFVGFVIITFLADWMCGIENVYLCNCIVCLMANSFLEEKILIYMFGFISPFFFKRRMYILCFDTFSAMKHCLASELHKNTVIQQQINWHAANCRLKQLCRVNYYISGRDTLSSRCNHISHWVHFFTFHYFTAAYVLITAPFANLPPM